jgi:transposase
MASSRTSAALVADLERQLASSEAARAAAEAARIEAEARLAAAEEARARLERMLKQMRRERFGAKSEKLDPDQHHLPFEDLEAAAGMLAAASEAAGKAISTGKKAHRPPQRNKGNLPAHLPRIERVIEPCAGARHAQASAPEWLAPRGLPTEALVAHGLVAKFGDYLPFYRQADIYRRQGIDLDRTMLAEWSGRAAQLLSPVIDAMMADLRRSDRLQMDETTVPALAPGTGAVRKDWLWVVLRDQRGWDGGDPPVVVFHHARSRGGEVAQEILKGFAGGTLLVDGHGGHDGLADPKKAAKPRAVACCWTHWRRRFVKFGQDTPSPICDEMIARLAQLYAIEKEIRGRDPGTRAAVRQKLSKPIIEALRPWLEACLQDLSSANELVRHIKYGLKRWDGLTRFLEDGRLEMDTNGVENAIRPILLTRRLHGRGEKLGAHRLPDRHLPAERGEPRGLHRRHASQDPRPAHAARHRRADARELPRIVKLQAEGWSARRLPTNRSTTRTR